MVKVGGQRGCKGRQEGLKGRLLRNLAVENLSEGAR